MTEMTIKEFLMQKLGFTYMNFFQTLMKKMIKT